MGLKSSMYSYKIKMGKRKDVFLLQKGISYST